MSYRIRCHTLFDVTRTQTISRRPSVNFTTEQYKDWEIKRNAQTNFDTVMQIISIRCQPENSSNPEQKKINFAMLEKFGFLFDNEEDQSCWVFDFDIAKENVFDDGIDNLGYLFEDCHGVPMTKTSREWNKLPDFLDTSSELRNIHFEVISHA